MQPVTTQSQTVDREKQPNGIHSGRALPPLLNGDHLTQAEFHRRYVAHPEIRKAELIEGVVYVASPVHFQHGEPHSAINFWAVAYQSATPGIRVADNTSTLIDGDNEVQPDVAIWIDKARGGRVDVGADGMLYGAPEMIVEIAASSAGYDLYDKLNVYRRNGVAEYLVLLAYERESRWFRLEEGRYELMQPDADGVYRSAALPGLWFSSDLFWAGKPAELLALVQQGLASEEHAAFVARLSE